MPTERPLPATASIHSVALPHGWFPPGRVARIFPLRVVRSASVASRPQWTTRSCRSPIGGHRSRMAGPRSCCTPPTTNGPSPISPQSTRARSSTCGPHDQLNSVRVMTSPTCSSSRIAAPRSGRPFVIPMVRSTRSTSFPLWWSPKMRMHRPKRSLLRLRNMSWPNGVRGRRGFRMLRRGRMNSSSHRARRFPTCHHLTGHSEMTSDSSSSISSGDSTHSSPHRCRS